LVTDEKEKSAQAAKKRRAELETKLKWKKEHQERSQKFGALRTQTSPKFWKNIRIYAEH